MMESSFFEASSSSNGKASKALLSPRAVSTSRWVAIGSDRAMDEIRSPLEAKVVALTAMSSSMRTEGDGTGMMERSRSGVEGRRREGGIFVHDPLKIQTAREQRRNGGGRCQGKVVGGMWWSCSSHVMLDK